MTNTLNTATFRELVEDPRYGFALKLRESDGKMVYMDDNGRYFYEDKFTNTPLHFTDIQRLKPITYSLPDLTQLVDIDKERFGYIKPTVEDIKIPKVEYDAGELGEIVAVAKAPENYQQILDELQKKKEAYEEQLYLDWLNSPKGEFKLNLNLQTTWGNRGFDYLNRAAYSLGYLEHLHDPELQRRWNNFSLGLLAPNILFAAPAVAGLAGTTAGNVIGNVAGSMAIGKTLEEGLRLFFGTSVGDNIVNTLNRWGVNPYISELGRIEYWLNPTGKYTSHLLKGLGLTLYDPMKAFTHVGVGNSIERTALHGRSYTPTDELKHYYDNKIAPWLDRNLDKLLVVHNPALLLSKNKKVKNLDVPEIVTVKNPSSEYNGTVELVVPNSLVFADKIYGDLLNLKAPKNTGYHYTLGYSDDNYSKALSAMNGLLKGAAAADLTFNEDQDPLIKSLELGILGRGALKGVINSRIKTFNKMERDYLSRLRSGLRRTLNNRYDIYNTKLKLNNSKSVSQLFKIKPGININKATFDDLVDFINKGSYGHHYKGISNTKFKVDDDVIVDKFGTIAASRGDDGKIVIHNDVKLKELLQKDIDIIDYKTGNHYKGKIQVGDDGEVSVPQEYLDILLSNVDYVKNEVFPGSGIKVYGSSSGVLGAGFPHATHDIDYYITQDAMDKLLKEGKVKPSEMLTKDTYRHLLKDNAYGELGWIDLNVIKKGDNGNATGFRAEELYRQYFPDEYFEALKTAAADKATKGVDVDVKIGRTPKELLEVMDPDTKSIMDSFDIDYTLAHKSKHKLRSWMHLIYSDPKKVLEAVLQYAKSKLGSGAKSFPISTDKLLDVQLNIEALKLLGVKLEDNLLNRIANDPERMKAVLDAWYIMDRTPMRYIRGSWPGINGYSANNFYKSATTWIPENNKGNTRGLGLNASILGDSRYLGALKAYILPELNYTETELIPLIDEINSKMGLTELRKTQLKGLSDAGTEAELLLLQLYNTEGVNFLSDLGIYGDGLYVSGTRPFTLPGDNVGFGKALSIMYPMIKRLDGEVPDFEKIMMSDRNLYKTKSSYNLPIYSNDYSKILDDYLYNPELKLSNRINNMGRKYGAAGTIAGGSAIGLSLAGGKDKNPYLLVEDNIDIVEHMNSEDKKKFSKDYILYKEKLAKGEKVSAIHKEIYKELLDILSKYTEFPNMYKSIIKDGDAEGGVIKLRFK